MSTLEQTLTEWGLYGADPVEPSRFAYRINQRREQAVAALDRLIDEAANLRTLLTVEDAGAWTQRAIRETGTAGYSNTVSTYSAEVVAHLAAIAGMIEALG